MKTLLPPAAPGELFREEQDRIAPGLQSIALYSRLELEKGSGSILTDVRGREYIDFVAGIGVASLGHSHPDYVRMVGEQLSRLSVGSFTTRNRVEFLKLLSTVLPGDLKRFQFYSSGAEAVEAALRLAKSHTKKYEVIGFWGGFHGKTGGVLGLLGDEFKKGLGPHMPGLHLCPYPNPYRCPLGAGGPHDCAAHCLEYLHNFIDRSTAGALCAVISEPVQGTAGNVIPPDGWLKGLAEIARENGALFICDEMLTGFGRTGKMFGFEHEDVVPDIVTLGKGLGGGFPVTGILAREEVAHAKPWANPSGSSSSYGGNPLAAAACRAALQIVLKEDLPEKARATGDLMANRLKEMQERHPSIGCVRGRGLMVGLELVEDRKTKRLLPKETCRKLFDACLRRGLLSMTYTTPVRINPPLNIPQDLARRGLDILDEALTELSL